MTPPVSAPTTRSTTVPDPAVAAMQNVLRKLTPRQTAALLSCMQGCEPEAFRFALDYAQGTPR